MLLRKLRRMAAYLILFAFVVYFIFQLQENLFFIYLAKIQFIPALKAITITPIFVFFIIVITSLFGRLYCSIICPLGLLQDVIINIKKEIWIKFFFYKK